MWRVEQFCFKGNWRHLRIGGPWRSGILWSVAHDINQAEHDSEDRAERRSTTECIEQSWFYRLPLLPPLLHAAPSHSNSEGQSCHLSLQALGKEQFGKCSEMLIQHTVPPPPVPLQRLWLWRAPHGYSDKRVLRCKQTWLHKKVLSESNHLHFKYCFKS